MEKQTLADFSLGAWLHGYTDMLQPRASLGALTEGYVDESGIVRCRGRVTQKIASALNGNGQFAWAGALLPGIRELVVSSGAGQRAYVVDAAGTGFAQNRVTSIGNVLGATVFGNAVVITVEGSLAPLLYGGSRKADFSAPACNRTQGSAVVTRATGGFTANVDVGMLVDQWQGTPYGIAIVKSVDSDTQLTMDRVWPGTTGLSTVDFRGPPWHAFLDDSFLSYGVYGSLGGRGLLLAGNRLYFSEGPDPTTGAPRTNVWPDRNVHEFPVDAQGIAIAALRDRVFCFAQSGIIVVSGMAYEIVDGSGNPQHPIEQLTAKSVAVSQRGIVTWQGSLIVPCRDGIYAMDGVGQPVKLSRALPWPEMVRDGLVVGQATVYKERYLLPYVYLGQSGVLAFRLDGVDTAVGTLFPLATFTLPGSPQGLATSAADSLLSTGTAADGVAQAAEIFTAETAGVDYDTTTAGGAFTMRTAPMALGDKAVVRRVRVRYTFRVGTATGAETLNVSVADRDSSSAGSVPIAATGSQWAAIDLATPLEADVVTVTVSLTNAKPRDFIVHAVEVLYRAFGGR